MNNLLSKNQSIQFEKVNPFFYDQATSVTLNPYNQMKTIQENSKIKPTANKLNNDLGKGLRVDAEKLAKLLNFITIPDRPNSSVFIAKTDCMRGSDLRTMICTDDDLTTELISRAEIVPGKTYIVADNNGNVFLGIIKRRPKAQFIYVHSQNLPLAKVPLSEIESINKVYRLGRRIMSDEDLVELIRLEDEFEAMERVGNHE